jgi:hypothetical protein
MTAPPLTVLMPVHNAATFVGEAIASVLAQSFGDFELLVIDDGSTDESLEVVRAFRDERIRVESRPDNRGLIETLNCGIRMARGTLIARMDADDVSYPERFAVQVDYLDEHPEVAGVSCCFDLIDERGHRLAHDHDWFRPTDPLALRWALNFGCYFAHGGAMLRTSVLRAAGFDPRYAHAEDYELWLRLVDEHRLANVPRVLLAVRRHGGNVSNRFLEVQRQNGYRALQASLERVLGRRIPLELVGDLFEGRLPRGAAGTRELAVLQGQLFETLTRTRPSAQVRPLAEDLAERLGVLAAWSLRRQPSSALMLATRAARYGFAAFARSFIATRFGNPHVYRRSPIFVNARLPGS